MAWNWNKQWNAQRGKCWICLEPMVIGYGHDPRAASEEHIVPKSRGGSDKWRNKLLAHTSCNGKRGAPFVWVKVSEFRRAAMKRVREGLFKTTVDGVDLMRSNLPNRSAETIRPSGRLVPQPSKMASKALRVTLAELSS